MRGNTEQPIYSQLTILARPRYGTGTNSGDGERSDLGGVCQSLTRGTVLDIRGRAANDGDREKSTGGGFDAGWSHCFLGTRWEA